MNRLVTELFFEKPNFAEVSKISVMLNENGINTILLPPEDRNINTHLVVEQPDLEKAKQLLSEKGIEFIEKEVMLLRLENKPGTMAQAAMKIAEKGINLTYAFSVTMDDTYSLVLLGSDDNKKALESLR